MQLKSKTLEAIIPIIIAGGSGSRLWPLSRTFHPKPFIKLADGQSFLQKSFSRAIKIPNSQEVVTVTNQELLFHTQSEYQAIDENIKTSYILEPMARGTTPAITAAALHLANSYHEDSILCIMPADHIIQDEAVFTKIAVKAIALAKENQLVAIGIKPSSPETDYGYLEIAAALPEDQTDLNVPSYRVERFIEKPDLDAAKQYISSGKHFWNSGIFFFSIKTILSELKQHAPEIFNSVQNCLNISEKKSNYIKLNSDAFAEVPENSIDYSVMEKSSNVAIVVATFGWSDVGSWNSMSELTQPDNEGNRVSGNALLHHSANCYIHGSNRLISTIGVENLAIIDTPDALLVLNRNHAQSVKQLVCHLNGLDNEVTKFHSEVHRPWGKYQVIGENTGFKIKLITVKPGAALSLQTHNHRSEHWVVVKGIATVVKGDLEFTVNTNESTYILANEKHRLKNPGIEDLIIVEVQCGEYLKEDDIIRYADIYDRISDTEGEVA